MTRLEAGTFFDGDIQLAGILYENTRAARDKIVVSSRMPDEVLVK